ncbi:MAG: phosphate ABC transporter ATP-binding protein [Desulfobacteraceae bacterium]|nr:MAG: phosphate ABC transporter ATP-binding protein [Desulfobacteraceae bacterium]
MEQQEKIILRNVNFWYGRNRILDKISMKIAGQTITAVMGPSGQGKTTFLGLFNRLWDDIPGAKADGHMEILLDNRPVTPIRKDIPTPMLRRKVGMIFQEPNPLPMSIAKNMAFPLKLAGIQDKSYREAKIKKALEQAFLWDEVKHRLHTSALDLSGGQKQRLCLARALVLEPEILLCDEPTSSLDAHAANVIEELLVQLKTRCTILMVSHNPDQVQRIADNVFELQNGRMNPSDIPSKHLPG